MAEVLWVKGNREQVRLETCAGTFFLLEIISPRPGKEVEFNSKCWCKTIGVIESGKGHVLIYALRRSVWLLYGEWI